MEMGSGIAKSGWRTNPNGGLTWTYGNYGGPGWSGGEFVKPTEKPKWIVRPLDPLDEIFKEHDEAYYAAPEVRHHFAQISDFSPRRANEFKHLRRFFG